MSDMPFPALQEKLGREVLLTDWTRIDQGTIERFAAATGDYQWIHVDVERAARESPFGCTIAHGYLTLSLLPRLLEPLFGGLGPRQILNYGCEKVRFPAPVPVDSRLRGRFVLQDLAPGALDSLKCTLAATVEIEGADKPACAAEAIFLLFP